MEIFVSGSAGFIGNNLVKKLVEMGNTVYVQPHTTRTGNWKNLKSVFDKIYIPLEFSEIGKLDVVFHLGMPSSSPMYKENPFCTNEAVLSSMKHIELAKKKKAKFIYASTSSIYNGNPIPWEEHMDINITDYYTETRYWLERLATLYNKLYKLKSVGLRLFSVYGPNDFRKGKYANVVTQFALDIINNKSPIVYGDGKQRRDFVHVYDVVDAFVKAIDYEETECDVFNVGTGISFSFNEAISLANKCLKKNIPIKYTENQIHNYVFNTLADIRKADTMLNFRAKRGFIEEYPKYVRKLKETFGKD